MFIYLFYLFIFFIILLRYRKLLRAQKEKNPEKIKKRRKLI